MLVAALVTFVLRDGKVITEYRRDKSAYTKNRNEFQAPIFPKF